MEKEAFSIKVFTIKILNMNTQIKRVAFFTFFLFPLCLMAQNVGIGTSTPAALLHTNGTATGGGNVLFTGSFKQSNPGPPPATGAGTRMMWYPDKAAFRAGHIYPGVPTNWDQDNIGNFSVAMGDGTMAKGAGSVALGSGSRATETYSVALGGGRALNFNTFSMGYTSTAVGYGSTAIGESVNAEGEYSIAMGAYATASGNVSIAMGNGVRAAGISSVAIGNQLQAHGAFSTAMGRGNDANGYGSMVVGRFNDSILARETELDPGANTPLFIVGNGTGFNTRSNALVVRANGKVGIAANTPAYELSIGENNLGIGRPASGTMAFYTAANERMRISPNGAVGIGTNNPNTLLEVRSSNNPTIRISNSTVGAARLDLQRAGTGASAGFDWRVQNDAGLLVFSRSEDDLVTAPNFYQFSNARFRPVPDNALALGASDGRWTTVFATNGVINTSDARLKEEIKPVPYGLQTVMQMNPVSFQWKDNAAALANLGFLAQEMQQLVPETVHDPGDGNPLGMKYSELIPVLVKAIQDLKKENESYRERLERLEQKTNK
jgi:trimeric autotransporter adhesin